MGNEVSSSSDAETLTGKSVYSHRSVLLTSKGSGTKIKSTESITFNAANSYSVCVGVGKQQKLKLSDVGKSADQDAILVYEFIQTKLGIPKSNSILYESTRKPALSSSVRNSIASYSKSVGKDGIFIFQFSGHCFTDLQGQSVLIPADFQKTKSTVMSMKSLQKCVAKSSARHVIFIFDCCYAGRAATEILSNWNMNSPISIFAACLPHEQSLGYGELGNGIFTYFLLSYWSHRCSVTGEGVSRDQQVTTFSLQPAIDYTQHMCATIISLLAPAYESLNPSMYPELHERCADVVDGGGSGDDVDVSGHPPPRPEHEYSHLLPYLNMCSLRGRPYSFPSLPPAIHTWLCRTAAPGVRHLWRNQPAEFTAPARGGTLRLYNTVLTLASQSLAALLHKALALADQDVRVCLQSEWFLVLFMHLSEMLRTVDVALKPSLEQLPLALSYYTAKVKQLLKLDFYADDLEELELLFVWCSDDVARQRARSEASAADVTDGAPPPVLQLDSAADTPPPPGFSGGADRRRRECVAILEGIRLYGDCLDYTALTDTVTLSGGDGDSE